MIARATAGCGSFTLALTIGEGTLIGAGAGNTVTYPKTFHLGFILPAASEVDELYQRLAEDGVAVEPPTQQHGAWAFAVQAPGGVRIVVRG